MPVKENVNYDHDEQEEEEEDGSTRDYGGKDIEIEGSDKSFRLVPAAAGLLGPNLVLFRLQYKPVETPTCTRSLGIGSHPPFRQNIASTYV